MQVGAGATARRGNAFGQDFEHAIEIPTFERSVWPSAADEVEELIFTEVLASTGSHHLLREDVQRVARNLQPVELTAMDRSDQRGAFNQLIARSGEQSTLGE